MIYILILKYKLAQKIIIFF